MRLHALCGILVALASAAAPTSARAGQATATAPVQATSAPDAVTVYQAYRTWRLAQPADVQNAADVLDRYAAVLRARGMTDAEVARTVQVLQAGGSRLEIDMWNRALTSDTPRFNTNPNAFLVEVVTGMKPGRALDVGMGQGRNAIYLAQLGWDTTGFDPADKAVDAARAQAAKLGVALTALVQTDDEFRWEDGQWDLIVLSYVGVRNNAGRVIQSLRPGGVVVVEGFHKEATEGRSIGRGVVFTSNELLRLFQPLRVLRYEDTLGLADFGREQVRIVRLAARKEP